MVRTNYGSYRGEIGASIGHRAEQPLSRYISRSVTPPLYLNHFSWAVILKDKPPLVSKLDVHVLEPRHVESPLRQCFQKTLVQCCRARSRSNLNSLFPSLLHINSHLWSSDSRFLTSIILPLSCPRLSSIVNGISILSSLLHDSFEVSLADGLSYSSIVHHTGVPLSSNNGYFRYNHCPNLESSDSLTPMALIMYRLGFPKEGSDYSSSFPGYRLEMILLSCSYLCHTAKLTLQASSQNLHCAT